MKKFGMISVCLASALFALTPLSSMAESAKKPAASQTAPAAPAAKQSASAKPASPTPAAAAVPQMNEQTLLSMVAKAQKMFWKVQTSKTSKQAFSFKGTPYVYVSEEFSTKEKVTAYFEQVFTKEASSFFFDQAGFELYQNKVTLVDGDFGSLLNWEKATATLAFERPSTKTYTLQVPLGDTGEKQELNVTVKLVPNVGWRIINSPNEIR